MAAGSGDGARTAEPGNGTKAYGFDTSVAHPARIWDYLLGGKDNFAADRAAVVPINHWRPGPAPDAEPEPALSAYAALGRKPA